MLADSPACESITSNQGNYMRQIIGPTIAILILSGFYMKIANAIELPVCVNKKTSA